VKRGRKFEKKSWRSLSVSKLGGWSTLQTGDGVRSGQESDKKRRGAQI